MSTPDLHLQTCFVQEGRIVSTLEPHGTPGPLYSLVRGSTSCAWAVRADVPRDIAEEVERLARSEPPTLDLRAPPVNAQRYLDVLGHKPGAASKLAQSDGVAFSFPAVVPAPEGVVTIERESLLDHHFRGWQPGEIEAGRAPVLAVFEDGHPVSVCFSARRSDSAAEAGLETAEAYRGRGFGPRATAAWALAIRAAGLVPLYSTSWTNERSLAVARKLGLVAYASTWAVGDSL